MNSLPPTRSWATEASHRVPLALKPVQNWRVMVDTFIVAGKRIFWHEVAPSFIGAYCQKSQWLFAESECGLSGGLPASAARLRAKGRISGSGEHFHLASPKMALAVVPVAPGAWKTSPVRRSAGASGKSVRHPAFLLDHVGYKDIEIACLAVGS
jgi:hypothetical protein